MKKFKISNYWAFLLTTVIILSGILFVSFNYIDLKSYTVWSTNLLDVLFEGRLMEFYSYCAENQYNLAHKFMGGDIFIIVFQAIWNIPIWAAQYFFNQIIVNNIFSLMWGKLFLVATLGATLFYTYKLCRVLLDKRKAMLTVFLSASSIFVYMGLYVFGQNDILMLLFTVMGIYYLLKERQDLFILSFAVAVAIKPFCLLIYIPILLLYEKNIYKLILKILSVFWIMILSKLIFINAPMYQESIASGPSEGLINAMLNAGVVTSFGNTSLFIIGFLTICFLAYIIKDKKYLIYMCVAPYMIYLMFVSFEPYRIILLVPFAYVLMMQNYKKINLNIGLEIIIGISFVLSAFVKYFFAFNVNYMNNTFLTGVCGSTFYTERKYSYIVSFLQNFDIKTYMPAISAVFFTSCLIFLIFNFPNNKLKYEGEKLNKTLLALRTIIIIPFIMINYYCYYTLI